MVGYVGQSVRIEFQRTSGFVGFDDIRVEALLPGYNTDGDVSRIVENNGNAYTRLSANTLNSRGVITTAAFLVGNDAQRLTLSMIGLSATTTNQYRIQVLHGPGYSETKSFSDSIGNSWQELSYEITEWQGQWVKLRIESRLTG